MPFQKNGVRQYDRELAWEHKHKKNRVKDRAARNKARAMVAKKNGTTPKKISVMLDIKKLLVEVANLF